MVELSLEQAFSQAKYHVEKGEVSEARKFYQAILTAAPNNKSAQEALATLQRAHSSTDIQGPSQTVLNQLLSLYNSGQLADTVKQAQVLIKQYPDAFTIWNILGAASKSLGDLDKATLAFKKVTELSPNNADGYNNYGVILKSQGKLEKAIEFYNRAILLKPNYADAYKNIGNAFQSQGKLEKAIEAYTKALFLMPNNVDTNFNTGNTYRELGKPEEAIEAYTKALILKPDYAEAYNNMGVAFHDQGKLDKALEAYTKALVIKPDYDEGHYNMGNTLKDQGKLNKAIEAYTKAISFNPNYTNAYNNMGVVLKAQGKLKEAIVFYTKALSLNPDCPGTYNNIGGALQDQGKLEEAIEAYGKALALKHDHAEAYNNMGVAFQAQGNLEEAKAVYNKALFFKPEFEEAYNNIGSILTDQGNLSEAMVSYTKALLLKPDYAEAYYNMGNALKYQGEFDRAIEAYDKALSIKPDYADAIWNRSLAFLSMEDFNRGWSQYEARWKQSNNTSIPLQSSKPRWKPNKSGRVLIWPEQGLGDLIMFSSVIPEIYKQVKKLIVQIDDRLIPLFKRSFPSDIIYFGLTERITEEQYDFHIPIGSLPLYFRKDLQSFKLNNGPYLKADTYKTNNLRSKLLSDGTKNLIGISWHSTNQLKGAQNRVISLSKLASISGSPKTKLISLQYGDVEKDIVDLFSDFNIKIHQVPEINNKNDIDGLASLISACDRIISIDNSTIHLAGALGKKSKLLLPYACDWRWGRNSNKSYWYNSVELYRQKEIGNWDEVISKL